MSDLKSRLASLSPEKLEQLNSVLKKKKYKDITKRPAGSEVEMSDNQRRLWFLHHLEDASEAYNMLGCIELHGKLNHNALTTSVNQLISRHEILRTSFIQKGNKLLQVISENHRVSIDTEKVNFESSAQWWQAVQKNWRKFSSRKFDLTSPGPFEFKLIERDSEYHLLLMNFHHIISDAWSLGLINKELIKFYSKVLESNSEFLPEPELQYGDYAYWQSKIEDNKQEASLHYWKEQLHDCPNRLSLNYDFSVSSKQTFNGKTASWQFDSLLVSRLHRFCHKYKKTPFMVLLAGLNAVLAKHTGQSDIVVGTSIANRRLVALEETLGFFANTLALRIRQDEVMTFSTLLNICQEVILGAHNHQEVSFEKVVNSVKPDRHLHHTPLFQVMLVLDNTPEVEINIPGLVAKPLDMNIDIAKFELTFYINLKKDSGTLSIQYNSDLFIEQSISALSEQFTNLLSAALETPDKTLVELPLLTKQQYENLAKPSGWNGNFFELNILQKKFEQQVNLYPDNTAISLGEDELSYQQLNQSANKLAHWLIKKGVKPGNRIGLYFDRGFDMIIALLATLKAGAIYIPLDPMAPAKRLYYILEDAAPTFVLSHKHVDVLEFEKTALLEKIQPELVGISEQNPQIKRKAENTAYIIYTSGSTGRPKGVMVSHGNITGLFAASQQWFVFDEKDVWTMFHSFAFDFSVWEIWGALLSGAKLVIVPYLISRSPEKVYHLLAEEKVTVLNQTPTAFNLLSHYESDVGCTDKLWLHYVILGGEALEFKSLLPWFERHGEAAPQLYNMFGITETTVHVTCKRVLKKDCGSNRSLIGEPLSDMQCYVLDKALNPLPNGVPGELYISGRGVSQGYWCREKLTSERFIDSPFGPEKLYRSGDLVRRIFTGELEYLGRLDHQVQIKGFRIELDEIESILAGYDEISIARCVVLDDGTEPRIACYIVAKATASEKLDTFALQQYLREYLPAYMIPASYNLVDTLPLTVNGKLDVEKLPSPLWGILGGHPYVEPEGEMESRLAKLWKSVLNAKRVGRHDNFFHLGGDSIKSITLVTRAKQNGLLLTVEDVFQTKSLSELALRLEQKKEQEKAKTEPFSLISSQLQGLLPDDVEDAYPMSSLQEGMIFHSEEKNRQLLYHNTASTLVKGEINIECFRRALTTLINRHEILRTAFNIEDFSQNLQIVYKSVPLPLIVEDLTELSSEAQRSRISEVERFEKITTFAIEKAPLFRVKVLLLKQDRFQFLLTEHHAIMDGWSVSQFFDELMEHYLAGGESDSRPVLEVKYRDFIAKEVSVIDDRKNGQFWLEQLADYEVNEILSWKDKIISDEYEYNAVLSENLTQAVNQIAEQFKLPLKSVLLAVHLAVISRLTARNKVLVGYSAHGRPEAPDADKMIGLFVSMLPLAVQVDLEDWETLCRCVHNREIEVFSHRTYPLSQIQRVLQQRNIIENCFNYIHFPEVGDRAAGLFQQQQRIQHQKNSFKFSTTFNIKGKHRNKILLSLEYSPEIYSRNQIKYIYQFYLAALESLTRGAKDSLSQFFSYLPEADTRSTIGDSSQSLSKAHSERIQELFEASVLRYPNAIALDFENIQITYHDLNQRANQLAHYLIENRFIKPDTLVGVCLERSVDLVVAIVAILKAGGAYVPLDPTYPLTRLEYMLNDADLRTVITDSDLFPELPFDDKVTVCVNDNEVISSLDSCSTENINSDKYNLKPSNLAYIIYTSGSTGKPKGVMVEHRNVVQLLRASESLFQFSETDVWTLFHSCSFDFSVWEIWGALAYGGKLVVVPYWITRDPTAFYRHLVDKKVTVLNHTPSAFSQLMQVDLQQRSVLSLRYIIFGGEALDYEALQPWFESHGYTAPQLVNMYGITETTVHVTYRPIMADDSLGALSFIGEPLPHLKLYILDDNLLPVPLGTEGELYVGGAGLTRGYLNRSELTDDRFIRNPLIGATSDRLYKTGDLARRLPNNELEYRGRKDQQVKIRGFRIELGEIEARLVNQELVTRCTVVAREDDKGKKKLVAYVVLDKTQNEVPEGIGNQLRERLAISLPDYMLPSSIVILERMPLTVNGKIDLESLPEPDSKGSQATYRAPNNTLQKILCKIWEDVLDVERIGIDDNFFSLGGDSIRVISIVAKARKAGYQFSIQDLFKNVTIDKLATSVLNQKTKTIVDIDVTTFSLLSEKEEQEVRKVFKSREIIDAYPLTQLQQGMLYHNLLQEEQGVYHDVMGEKVRCPWNPELFSKALTEVVENHRELNAVFRLEGERPLQVIVSDNSLPLVINDLRALDENAQLQQLDYWEAKEITSEFDFTRPLWKVVIHLLDENHFYYFLCCHHALLDGWSVASFNTELFSNYLALVDGRKMPGSQSPLPFSYFVALEEQAVKSSVCRNFWASRLEGTQLSWWTGKEAGESQVLSIEPSSRQCSAISALARELEVQEKSVFLAAHLVFVALLCGNRDILTSVVCNARPEMEGGERTLGLFLNALPMRMNIKGYTWSELVSIVDREQHTLVEHKHFPVSEIKSVSGLDFSGVLFNYVDFHVYEKLENKIEVMESRGFTKNNYLVECNFSKGSTTGKYFLSMNVDKVVLNEINQQRIRRYIDNIFKLLADEPMQLIDTQKLMGMEEIGSLMESWRNHHVDHRKEMCVHELFESVAANESENVALIFEQQQITYKELNQRANRLANYLIKYKGISCESLVGICLERSPDMVVALLAVLKASAAYVPLDPGFPPERLKYMLDDAKLAVVISTCDLDVLPHLPDEKHLLLDQPEVKASVRQLPCSNISLSPRTNNVANLAYVIYTSGSTGRPKGVMVEHQQLLNFMISMADDPGISKQDRLLAVTSTSFDIHGLELFLPLLNGAKVVLATGGDTQNPDSLKSLLRRHKVTVMQATPSTWKILIDAKWSPSAPIKVLCGGEALSDNLRKELVAKHNVTLWNMYGPTETTIWSAVRKVLPQDDKTYLGGPIKNTAFYVLNSELELVPQGVMGELYIAGDGVARGYLNRADLTRERFIDNTFIDGIQARIYRTGDLVRLLSNGKMDYCGRVDNQIKVRGYRIELGEIEAVLDECTLVKGSIVVMLEESNLLSAYIIADTDSKVSEQVREFLRGKVPGYMVPDVIVPLSKFPLTPNGKIDRMALPKPDFSKQVGYTAPETEIETKLCGVWQQLLSVDKVGIDTNFFDIGGNSILLTRLLMKIDTKFKCKLTVRELFELNTIRELASHIEFILARTTSEREHLERLSENYGEEVEW